MNEDDVDTSMASTVENRLVVVGLALLAALFVLPTIGMGLFGTGHMGSGMWGGMWDDGMWGIGSVSIWMFIFAALSQLVFLGLLATGAYVLYRAVTGNGRSTDHALEELRLAYARGDLSDEEFERRRERLERDDFRGDDYQS